MKSIICGTIGLFGLLTTSASAATPQQCEPLYKNFVSAFNAGAGKEMSGERVATVNRYALRGYDSCQAGDAGFSAEEFWKKLERQATAKDWAKDFWEEQDRGRTAK